MSINRRQFLKKAAIVSALGLTGTFALNGLRRDLSVDASETASAPGSKRWGMVINMDKFKTQADIQRVIDACHITHNVPDFGNAKDEIKWIWTDKFANVFPTAENHYLDDKLKKLDFLATCNQCDNPPCVRACPTKATFKNSEGIVKMDMHRCIGCRFCMAACPYGARSFNFRDPRPFIKNIDPSYPTRTKGVVEKCNFCVERLAKGLRPACVEASNGALIFGDLNDPGSEIRKTLASKYTMQRKPNLGTLPSVYYLIGGGENA